MSTRGLGDIGHQLDELLGPGVSAAEATTDLDLVEQVLIYKLKPGRSQPRTIMHDETLVELAKSIKEHGIIQPIVVMPINTDGEHEIIAGERRWRAARLANLQQVPVIVRRYAEDQSIAVALIENIQREDLNVLDYIKALHRLHTECSMTHQQIAQVIGKSRVAVTNLMRLLQLEDKILKFLSDSKLDVGHARCLLSLPEVDRFKAAEKIIAEGMSVRAAERLVNMILRAQGGQKKEKVVQDLKWQSYKDRISYSLKLNSRISNGRGKSVNLELTCKNPEQLEKLVKLLEELKLD